MIPGLLRRILDSTLPPGIGLGRHQIKGRLGGCFIIFSCIGSEKKAYKADGRASRNRLIALELRKGGSGVKDGEETELKCESMEEADRQEPDILEEIEIEDFAVDGICGVY